jgi:hypothetical protein
VAQCKLCGQGAASHGVVDVRAAKGSPATALDGRGIERKHGETEAVAEAGLHFPVLERQGLEERERVQRGRGRAACAAEEASVIAPARVGAGVV